MMLKLGLLLACLLPISLCQNKDLDMFGLINMLYLKADKNLDGTITQTELDDIFKGFDANGDGKVTPAEFVPTWMVITHFSKELANAYFVLADLNADGVINHKDLTVLYSRFDIDGNGKVSGEEFNHKWQDIYKESAFAVLFTRADADKNEHLSKAEFTNLFEPFDSDNDNAVTRSEFEAGWTKENFGNKAQADTLFRNLDSNHDNKITSVDTNRIYMTYNANRESRDPPLLVVAWTTTTLISLNYQRSVFSSVTFRVFNATVRGRILKVYPERKRCGGWMNGVTVSSKAPQFVVESYVPWTHNGKW